MASSGSASAESNSQSLTFDPATKEAELLAEATSWDVTSPIPALHDDIPIVDLESGLETAAHVLRDACETVGFFQLVGHDISQSQINEIFHWTKRFHDLPVETKQSINIDKSNHPVKGVGYLPYGERRLPRRAKGNRNEAFLIKSDLNHNQWLDDTILPGFRQGVELYAATIESLALKLVKVFAVALELDPSYFDAAFEQPFWRLRMTHYPPVIGNQRVVVVDEEEENGAGGSVGSCSARAHGIAPHVDTSFFTLLLQDSPGLVIYSARRQKWIQVPFVKHAFVVNVGELLKQWSNDRFISARHFADNNNSSKSRYSIPFFLNANADYPMKCLPTCCSSADGSNPPKYPTISYNQSQAIAQGE